MSWLSKKLGLGRNSLNEPETDPANNSQIFGFETNLNKEQEKLEIKKATGSARISETLLSFVDSWLNENIKLFFSFCTQR